MAAEEVQAAGVFELRADGSQFAADIAQAEAVAARFERTVVAAFNRAGTASAQMGDDAGARRFAASTEREIMALERKTAALTLSQAALRQYEASGKGIADSVAGPLVTRLGQAEAAFKSLSASIAQAANAQAFDRILTDSVKLGQVGKNIDSITSALERLQGEEQRLAQTKVFEARVAEAAKLGMAEQYMARYTQAGANMSAAERAFAADRSFVDGLKRRSDAIGKTQSDLLELEAAERGVSAQAAPFIAKMREQERALGIYSAGARDARVQTNQMRTALQQLPAQFTDIFTSLAGGQNPLLVLIQQGGQIKDSFGGVGNVLRGIGGAIAAAFTPVKMLIGGAVLATAALTGAFVAAEKEAAAYRQSLALTNNAAGTTIGQMQAMAQAVSAVTGGTQGKAAEVLAALAGSAQVAGRDLQKLTAAAIALERAGGPAALDTAKAFASLAESPTQAAQSLTKSTNFLTAAVYEEARALELQGKKSEAASVVQRAYADAVQSGARDLEAGLGTLEKAWRTVGDAAKGAYDSMLDIGRTRTPEQRVADIQSALEANARRTDSSDSRDPVSGRVRQGADAQRQQLLDELWKAKSEVAIKAAEAVGQAFTNEANKGAVEFSKLAESVKLPTLALKQQVEQVKTFGAAAVAAGTATQAQVDAMIARVTSLSAANQQSMAATQASIQASAVVQAAKTGETLQDLQHQRAMGLISEYQLIEKVAAANVDAARAEEARIQQAIANAKRLPIEQQEAPLTLLQGKDGKGGQAAAAAIATAQARKKAEDQLAESIRQRELATRALVLAVNDEVEAEVGAFNKSRKDRFYGAKLEAEEYRRSLEDAAYALGVEAQAAAQSDLQRTITSRHLQVELDLRKKIRGIELEVQSGQITYMDSLNLIDEQRQLAVRAAQQLSSKIVQDFEINGARQISDAFLSSLEDGVDSAFDYLKKLAKRQIIEIAFRPIANSVVGAVQGAITELQGGTSTNASYIQAASALQSAYGYGKSAYGWLMGSSAAGASTLGSSTAAYTSMANSQVLAAYGFEGAGATAGGVTGAAAAGSTAGASSGSLASTASSWGPYVAAVIASYLVSSSAYKKGFTSSNLDSKFWESGSAAIGFPEVTNLAARLMTSLGIGSDRNNQIFSGAAGFNYLFGLGAPHIAAQGVQGTIGAGAFSGTVFADIVQNGGLFRSDKRSTQTAAVTQEMDRFFDDAAKAVLEKSKEFGAALGLPVDALAGVTKDIRVELVQAADDTPAAIKTAAEANMKAIGDSLTGYGDELVKGYAEAIKPLAVYGETTIQTIERVGGAIKGVNEVLDSLGVTALSASIGGGQAASALQQLFGGIEGLQQAASGYLQNYYTDSERAALTTKALSKTLGDVGLQLPATRDGFKQLVQAQDLTTESGRAAFAALMGTASAFAAITPAARTATDILKERDGLEQQLLQAQGNTAALRERERNALDESNRALYDQIKALEDQKTATEEQQAAAEKAAAAQRTLADAISGAIGKFQTPEQRAAYGVNSVVSNLGAVGINVTARQLTSASLSQIGAAAAAIVGMADASVEVKLAAVNAASAMADLAAVQSDLATTAAEKAATATRALADAIDAAIGKFQTPAQRVAYGVDRVAANLGAAGIAVTPDQLMRASLADIGAAAAAIVNLSTATDEAKLAAVNAAGALADLSVAAADVARSGMQAQIDAITNEFGDVTAALAAPTERLADAYTRGAREIKDLQTSLDGLIGGAAKSVQQVLSDMLHNQQALRAYRTGTLADSIESARLGSLTPAARIAALRSTEASLFAQIGTADDPVAIAERLSAVITDRIRVEADLSTAMYGDQITALTRLRDLSADIAQATAQLRIGDKTILTPAEQLAQARTLFESTLSAASGGDAKAQGLLIGNANTYIDEARSFFASAGDYANVFRTVTSALDALGLTGAGVDGQITDLQSRQSAGSDTAGLTYEALRNVDTALAARDERMSAQVDQQIALARQQITEAQATNDALRSQLELRAAEIEALRTQLAAIGTQVTSIATLLEREAAHP